MNKHQDLLDIDLNIDDIVAAVGRYSKTHDLRLFKVRSMTPTRIKVVQVDGKGTPLDAPPDPNNPYYKSHPDQFARAEFSYNKSQLEGSYLIHPAQCVKVTL